jgi:hypothetical protein
MDEETRARIEDLENRLKDAQVAQHKAEERSENAQKVINEHRERIGRDSEYKKASEGKMLDLVGELTASNKALKEQQDLLAQVQDELVKLKKQGPTPREQPTRTVAQQIEDIEKSLTDEDRMALGKAIEQADDDVKAAVVAASPTPEQDALYLELLQALRASKPVPSVPRWQRHTPEQRSDGTHERDLTKLFEQKKRAQVWTPPGPEGGTPRAVQRPAPAAAIKPSWVVNAR